MRLAAGAASHSFSCCDCDRLLSGRRHRARAVTSFSSYIVRAKPNGCDTDGRGAGRHLAFKPVWSSLFAPLFTYLPEGERKHLH
jgi:hypothetical protein